MRSLSVMLFVAIAAVGAFGQGADGAVTSSSVLRLEHATAAAFANGQYELAATNAKELLAAAPEIQTAWNYGDAIHTGHIVLGRVAVVKGDLDEAERQLLASVAEENLPYGMKMLTRDGVERQRPKTKASPTMDTFGPDMTLARDLIAKGRTDAVLKYFTLCSAFWDSREKLAKWTEDLKAGRTPDFGPNLVYFFPGTTKEK